MARMNCQHRPGELAFHCQGPEDGQPVFYCHGTPGSGMEPLLRSGQTDPLPIRVISLDRPGYGGSSPLPDYSLGAHAGDLAALADHLGYTRFSLFGFSAGGVFALAAAAALGERVQRLVLAATPAPRLLDDPFAETAELTAETWRAAADDPAGLAAQLSSLTTDGDTLAGTMLAALSDSEQTLLARDPVKSRFRANMTHAVAGGAAAAANAIACDAALLMADPDFDTNAIGQPVHVWHGAGDALLTPRHAEAIAASLPDCSLEIGPGGHYTGIYGQPAAGLWQRAIG